MNEILKKNGLPTEGSVDITVNLIRLIAEQYAKEKDKRIKELEKECGFWEQDRNDVNNMFTERFNKWNENLKEYVTFCILCDRESVPLLEYSDWLDQYGKQLNNSK